MLGEKKVRIALGVFSIVSYLILAGCSTIPKSISGGGEWVSPLSYEQLVLNPTLYFGQEVRIGGKVVNVINLSSKTVLDIAVLPLDDSAMPDIHHKYQGRIFVYSDRFLEPETYLNHYVTILGKMDGTVSKPVGKRSYPFIKLVADGFKIWKLDTTFIPKDGWVYAWAPEWTIAPPQGYIYYGPQIITDNSYLSP